MKEINRRNFITGLLATIPLVKLASAKNYSSDKIKETTELSDAVLQQIVQENFKDGMFKPQFNYVIEDLKKENSLPSGYTLLTAFPELKIAFEIENSFQPHQWKEAQDINKKYDQLAPSWFILRFDKNDVEYVKKEIKHYYEANAKFYIEHKMDWYTWYNLNKINNK